MTSKYNHQLKCSCVNCKTETTSANISSHWHSCTQHLFPKKPSIKIQHSYICTQCNKEYKHTDKNSKFCSHSCAATNSNNNRNLVYTNEMRKTASEKSISVWENKRKEKQKFLENFIGPKQIKHRKRQASKTKRIPQEIVGDYSKIFFRSCKICSDKFITSTNKLICEKCKIEHKKLYFEFRFKFNVYDYPDLFDLENLSEIGFYSPGGKSGKWNINGMSRDHRVSVSDSVKYRYDPYYITHPINCELMPHSENNKKKTKSSITYEQLIKEVDEYEKSKVKIV